MDVGIGTAGAHVVEAAAEIGLREEDSPVEALKAGAGQPRASNLGAPHPGIRTGQSSL